VDELLLNRVQTNDSEKASQAARDGNGRPVMGLGLTGIASAPSGSLAALRSDTGATSADITPEESTRGRGKVSPKL